MMLRKWLACICARNRIADWERQYRQCIMMQAVLCIFLSKEKLRMVQKPAIVGVNVADALSLSTQAVNMVQSKSGNPELL